MHAHTDDCSNNDHTSDERICLNCGYSLRGHPAPNARCPECGVAGPDIREILRSRACAPWRRFPAQCAWHVPRPICTRLALRRIIRGVIVPLLIYFLCVAVGNSIVVRTTRASMFGPFFKSGVPHEVRPFEFSLDLFKVGRARFAGIGLSWPRVRELFPPWIALGVFPAFAFAAAIGTSWLICRRLSSPVGRGQREPPSVLLIASLFVPSVTGLVGVAYVLMVIELGNVLAFCSELDLFTIANIIAGVGILLSAVHGCYVLSDVLRTASREREKPVHALLAVIGAVLCGFLAVGCSVLVAYAYPILL